MAIYECGPKEVVKVRCINCERVESERDSAQSHARYLEKRRQSLLKKVDELKISLQAFQTVFAEAMREKEQENSSLRTSADSLMSRVSELEKELVPTKSVPRGARRLG